MDSDITKQSQTQQPNSSKLDISRLSLLLPADTLSRLAREWLREDIPSFDWTALCVGLNPKSATLRAKSNGILAGVPFFNAVFSEVGCTVHWYAGEGDWIEAPKVIAKVDGPAARILQGERSALNILSRLSGIASGARKALEIARSVPGFTGCVAGTRKTEPGLRLADKYAVAVGGADIHRMDLSSLAMIKDNHIDALGSVIAAVAYVRRMGSFAVKIEVECRGRDEAMEALNAGADILMLDHVKGDELRIITKEIKAKKSNVLVEVSGGIIWDNLKNIIESCPEVDIVSMGCLTQDVTYIDFSLKINKENSLLHEGITI